MKIFRKDKDKDKDKDKESGLSGSGGVTGHNSVRGRTQTQTASLPNIYNAASEQTSNNNNNSNNRRNSTSVEQNKNYQTSIRIGDTRFYGRIICRARALYDYPLDGDTLQVDDEEIKLLKFKKGDIINVYEQDPSGWWAGEFNEEKGIFPGSYMKVLEEEPTPEPSQHKQKTKSQNISRDELNKKVNEMIKQLEEAEVERDKLISERERDKDDFNKKMKEARTKAEAEIQELKKTIQERDEVIQANNKRIKSMESELEDLGQKLSTKEVEVLTMELEIEEYRSKIPDKKAQEKEKLEREKQEKEKHEKERQQKDASTDLSKKNAELQDITKQKQEIEKSVKEAQAKLAELESQILKKVMSSPTPTGDTKDEHNKDKQIDLLKKQLGEEVFERRRLENEIREMKRMCVDMENLKNEKAKLEAEVIVKADLESKLSKINIILQGLINKDDSTLTVSSIKDMLTKVRKGISPTSPGGSGSATNVVTPPETRRPKTMTMSFYNKES